MHLHLYCIMITFVNNTQGISEVALEIYLGMATAFASLWMKPSAFLSMNSMKFPGAGISGKSISSDFEGIRREQTNAKLEIRTRHMRPKRSFPRRGSTHMDLCGCQPAHGPYSNEM